MERKVRIVGTSLVVTIPSDIAHSMDIKNGGQLPPPKLRFWKWLVKATS